VAVPSPSLRGEALVDGTGNVWLPYDLPRLRAPSAGWTRLSSRRGARHAGQIESSVVPIIEATPA